MNSDDRQVVSEIEAAVAILRRHRPALAVIRLTCAKDGSVRLWLERVEGVPLRALSGETLERQAVDLGGGDT